MNPGHGFEACRMRLAIPVAVTVALLAAGAGAAPAVADVLSGVSCSAAKACTGVGDYANSSGASVTLAERWNGSSWSVQPTPTPGGDGSLGDVSCASATACMAVGSSSSGSSGTQAAPSCTSSSACMAVGDYVDSTGTQTPLSELWKRGAWAQEAVSGPIPGTFSQVSCSAASACTAIEAGTGWVERWNGSTWSVQNLTYPTLGSGLKWWMLFMELDGVSCATASSCTVVGHEYGIYCFPGALSICECLKYGPCTTVNRTFVESWNGTSWSLETVGQGGNWSSLSCASTSCTAVGTDTSNQTLAMQSVDDGSWTSQITPDPAGATGSSLADVSCTSSSACTAVGQDINGSATGSTLAERWNGSAWTIQTHASDVTVTDRGHGLSLWRRDRFCDRSGTVNPNGTAATYHFDYGTSTNYGSQAPAPPDPSAGSGTTAQTESTTLTGLSPNTVYHSRIEATNSSGTSYGGDQTFTTTGTGTSPIVATGSRGRAMAPRWFRQTTPIVAMNSRRGSVQPP
jgi:hypothetical protein